MFKQVVLSTTRYRSPSLFVSSTTQPQRSENFSLQSSPSIRDLSQPQFVSTTSVQSHHSASSIARSVSWDNVTDITGNHDVRVFPQPGVNNETPNNVSTRNEGQSSIESNYIVDKMRTLVSAFAERALHVKSRISRPLSSSTLTDNEIEYDKKVDNESSLSFKVDWLQQDDNVGENLLDRLRKRQIGLIDPQGCLYLIWLAIVTSSFLYNCWTVFLLATFPYQTVNNITYFIVIDLLCDLIYLVDITIVKCRLTFLEHGHLIRDLGKSRCHYFQSKKFRLDCMSLLPVDLVGYIFLGRVSILRLPRALKLHSFWEFFDRIDAIAKWPYLIRIVRTLLYMMFLVHLNACAYYYVSYLEGFDTNDWVYNGHGNAYLRCFYFAIRTATSISGKMPKPTNTWEYLFMTVSWLLGIFVFAFLIGQIRDIVATANQNKAHFRQLMDSIIRHMSNLGLTELTQRRIRLWLNHSWQEQKIFEESKIVSVLPQKMRNDLANDIHFTMLSRVELFKGCDRNVLRDIVTKLKPVLYLPGDFICVKGEIGHEMYIINEGLVQVIDNDGDGDEILAVLYRGAVFGELSVLGIPGCSRRTASVRSVGFSNLFVLAKTDLWETLRNYPEAQVILKKKTRRVMRERAAKESEHYTEVEPIIGEVIKPDTPKLCRTVMDAISGDSECCKRLKNRESKKSVNACLGEKIEIGEIRVENNCLKEEEVNETKEICVAQVIENGENEIKIEEFNDINDDYKQIADEMD